ncbi:hypothetical protein NIES4071_34280 [Calothrix sp. NIES-4071]|nr:hypothetical protein NIES4071_34280 [Calothrix sp. NIES-4071]BAZ57747.1 hypothetical protein NIES4105_34210 [Calothrix sp. NIES-4105]
MTQLTKTRAVKAFINTEKTLEKLPSLSDSMAPENEKIKHILIGSQRAVTITIRVLDQLGYANITDWSPILPSENPGEVISVLIRSISVR